MKDKSYLIVLSGPDGTNEVHYVVGPDWQYATRIATTMLSHKPEGSGRWKYAVALARTNGEMYR